MKLDSKGNPDVCREVFGVVEQDARDMMTVLKLQMNNTIGDLSKLLGWNPNPEVKRLLAMAISDIEVGTMLAVKAMTTEGFLCRGETSMEKPQDAQHPGR